LTQAEHITGLDQKHTMYNLLTGQVMVEMCHVHKVYNYIVYLLKVHKNQLYNLYIGSLVQMKMFLSHMLYIKDLSKDHTFQNFQLYNSMI